MNISKDTRGRDTQSAILNWLEAQGGLEQLIQQGIIKIKYTISEESIIAACNRLHGDIGEDLKISQVAEELGVSDGRLRNWLSQEFTKLHPGEKYRDYFRNAMPRAVSLDAVSDTVDIKAGPGVQDSAASKRGHITIENIRRIMKEKNLTNPTLLELAAALHVTDSAIRQAIRRGKIKKDDLTTLGIRYRSAIGSSI